MTSRKRILFWIGSVFVSSLVVIGAMSLFAQGGFESWQVNEIVDEVIQNRVEEFVEDDSVSFGDDNEINVLLLGIDARKGYENPHCDAIHMLTVNIENWTLSITSVPRGTYAYIPPGNYADNEYYLANACAFAGLDYGIAQIEKVVGVKADYYVTVGFSQVLGILRVFEMPTTETLQWLRHRQSYAIGDPQRSHNQAVFLKDMVIMQLPTIKKYWSKPMLYLLYSMVDTDMDFNTAYTLLQGYIDSGINQRPDDIVLSMKPYYETVDYHLDLQNPSQQIGSLLDRIRPYLSSDDLSDKTLSDIQGELIAYLDDALIDDDEFQIVVQQQLWLQIEDDSLREEYHYAFIEKYAYTFYDENSEDVVDVVSAYIMEKELLEIFDWAERGRGLLAYFVAQNED
ncbi:LCP family protein [Patescibacteria group bacterium]|nr:LCP family protein [Patescibacteria group bacterium]